MTRPARWCVTILIINLSTVATGWVLWRVFGDSPPVISAGTAAAFSAFFGLPLATIALWKWRVERDRPL